MIQLKKMSKNKVNKGCWPPPKLLLYSAYGFESDVFLITLTIEIKEKRSLTTEM